MQGRASAVLAAGIDRKVAVAGVVFRECGLKRRAGFRVGEGPLVLLPPMKARLSSLENGVFASNTPFVSSKDEITVLFG